MPRISIISGLLPVVLIVHFCSCKKPSDAVNNNGQPPLSQSLSGHVTLYMTDYYPDSFYHRYANADITNDSVYLNIHLGVLNNFSFRSVKIIVGSFDHVKNAISVFTTPPLSEIGPQNPDYSQDLNNTQNEPLSYDLQIKRSSLPGNNIYIYLWARVDKFTNGVLTDWHGCWAYSKMQINNDAATSYFGYYMP